MKTASTAALVLSLGLLASCNEKIKTDALKKSVNVDQIKSSSASPSEKAELLALAAEQLLTPSGFIYADQVLDMALKLDPNNKRAGLYKSFLAAPMSTKGILKRIAPLAAKTPEGKLKLEEMISKLPDGNYKKFLLDGKADIADEAGAQAFADSVIKGLEKFRLFAKNNKKLSITLNVNDYLTSSGSYEYHSSHCNTYPDVNGNYTTECYQYEDSYQNEAPSSFALNRGDFEALQHISAGYQIYASLLNSYSVSGILKTSQNQDGKTGAALWKELTKDANFGKLRNDAFAKVSELGSDAIIGVRWAMKVQKELCPSGVEESGQRPGMLFGNGICIKESADAVENALKIAELALKGGRFNLTQEGHTVTEIAPKALLNNPVKDLKALKPKFNDCGRIVSVSDASLNGLFPKGDLNDMLSGNSDCANKI